MMYIGDKVIIRVLILVGDLIIDRIAVKIK